MMRSELTVADRALLGPIALTAPNELKHNRHTVLNWANQISESFGRQLAYNADTGAWYLWNGVVYAEIEEADVKEMIRMFPPRIVESLRAIDKDTLNKAEEANLKFASNFELRLETPAGQTELLNQLRDVCTRRRRDWEEGKRYTVLSDGWRIDHTATRALKGVSVALLEPDPHMLVTRSLNATWKPGTIPEGVSWVQDLLTHVIPDATGRQYLLEMFGASLFGKVLKHIPNLVGKPDSFKSRVLYAAHYMMGDYSGTVNATAFAKATPNFYRTEFEGRRMTWVSDPSIERVDNEFLLSITGGEIVKAAVKGTKDVQFYPEGNIFLASNQVIHFNAAMPQLNSRMDVVKFEHSCKPGKCPYGEHGLDAYNELYADAWLYLAIEAYLQVLASGGKVHAPRSSEDERRTLAGQANSAVRWLEAVQESEEYLLRPDTPAQSCVPIPVAHSDYAKWCEDNLVPVAQWLESGAFAKAIRSYMDTEPSQTVRSPLWPKPGKVLLDLVRVTNAV